MKHNPKVAERELTEDIIAFERENNEISQICQQCWSFLNYFSSFHPSIICLPFILVRVAEGLEAIPATIGQEAGCILEIRQSVTGLSQTMIRTHINPTNCMSLDCKRKPEYMGRTCKLHTETFLLRGFANPRATALPLFFITFHFCM